MYCFAEFVDLKRDYKFCVLTQTADDMAEFINDNYASYIVCNDIDNSEDDYFECEVEVLWK